MLLAAVAVFTAACLAATLASLRRAHRAERALARSEATAIGGVIAPAAPSAALQRAPRPAAASSLRRDVRATVEARTATEDRAVLTQLLKDHRDLLGAEEAIFWRWEASRDGLTAGVSSSPSGGAEHFDMAAWAPLVQWSAESGVVQTAGREDAVEVATAMVSSGDTMLGVLSVTAGSGIRFERSALRAWMPRLAAQLASAHGLLEVRRRYGDEMRRGQALLDAVQRIQTDPRAAGLPRAACETALAVSGARGATLIRWDADGDTGELHYATAATGLTAPVPLGADSVVAEACRRGELLVIEDARSAVARQGLYGQARTIPEPAAVAVVPLRRDGRTLGALVLESDAVGGLTLEDCRPLMVLGAVVAGALEMAWSFAEVDRRARTDPLTGLYNRMHFGEQLERSLAEADRFGQPLSLVVVDVDHFKRVNDTWGHEAGDAVLKAVATIVREGTRSVDTCVRYGGEELAMLLSHTDGRHAMEVAERLRARIAGTVIRHGGAEIGVTASFGVATYPESVRGRDQLFPSADKALYAAKHEGRNRVNGRVASRDGAAG